MTSRWLGDVILKDNKLRLKINLDTVILVCHCQKYMQYYWSNCNVMQLRNFFVDVRHFRGAQQPVRGESARKPRVAADAALTHWTTDIRRMSVLQSNVPSPALDVWRTYFGCIFLGNVNVRSIWSDGRPSYVCAWTFTVVPSIKSAGRPSYVCMVEAIFRNHVNNLS